VGLDAPGIEARGLVLGGTLRGTLHPIGEEVRVEPHAHEAVAMQPLELRHRR